MKNYPSLSLVLVELCLKNYKISKDCASLLFEHRSCIIVGPRISRTVENKNFLMCQYLVIIETIIINVQYLKGLRKRAYNVLNGLN